MILNKVLSTLKERPNMKIVYILYFVLSSSFSQQGYFADLESCSNAKETILQKRVYYHKENLVCIPTGFTNDKFKAIKHKVI